MANIDSGTIVPPRMSERQRPSHAQSKRNILGVDVSVFSKQAALQYIARRVATKTHVKLSFLNAHGANIAYADNDYRKVLAQFEVLPDGVGVDFNSIINYGEKFPDNLNGTDFVPAILQYLTKGVSVGLIGGTPGVAIKAAAVMNSLYPQHIYTVVSHGFFGPDDEVEIRQQLADIKPDILLVAMGNPKQEIWIAENCNENNCSIAFGVGAYFDFVAERIPRAPDMLRRLRLEWLYRLWLEPGRMWRRYLVGNPVFLMRSIRQRFARGQNGSN